jgi:hypothetical protein
LVAGRSPERAVVVPITALSRAVFWRAGTSSSLPGEGTQLSMTFIIRKKKENITLQYN